MIQHQRQKRNKSVLAVVDDVGLVYRRWENVPVQVDHPFFRDRPRLCEKALREWDLGELGRRTSRRFWLFFLFGFLLPGFRQELHFQLLSFLHLFRFE